ncbi:hypothetical protein IR083_21955 [Dysgonomonas sp. GY75]|uniref:hypothetical protein n=1 Tax=Dysgonomonas sp. GY75 TaxID=2780419 RepID=UPI0018845A34|nr:hypothetical protein [Dysgonomonas sp. GY75]MBF0651483.1 hypothetical protein [Dysgonomonas sp. GY75]
MDIDRLNLEKAVLSRYFPPSNYMFNDIGTRNAHLLVGVKTNSEKVYTLKIDLSQNFPYNIPKVFIIHPQPLLSRYGGSLMSPSASMHVLQGESGCVRICHYGTSSWSANVTLYKVILKSRMWLEMYENHLKTGYDIDKFLPHQP